MSSQALTVDSLSGQLDFDAQLAFGGDHGAACGGGGPCIDADDKGGLSAVAGGLGDRVRDDGVKRLPLPFIPLPNRRPVVAA